MTNEAPWIPRRFVDDNFRGMRRKVGNLIGHVTVDLSNLSIYQTNWKVGGADEIPTKCEVGGADGIATECEIRKSEEPTE